MFNIPQIRQSITDTVARYAILRLRHTNVSYTEYFREKKDVAVSSRQGLIFSFLNP